MLRILGLSTVTFNDIVERIGITVLNSVLFYFIATQLKITDYLAFGEGIIIVLTALLPYILAPAITLIYIVSFNFSSLLLNGSAVSLVNMENFVIMLVFLFILPVLIQVKGGSLQGFITAESSLSLLFSPSLVGIGVAEKGRDLKFNILSSLAVLYIIITYVLNNLAKVLSQPDLIVPVVLGFILFIISSVVFTRRSALSVLGLIPLYPSISFMFTLPFTSTLTIVGTIIGGLVNGLPVAINALREKTQAKSTLLKEKNQIIGEIEQKIVLVNNIKGGSPDLPVDLISALSEIESKLKDSISKINSCNDSKCITSMLEDFRKTSEEIDKMLNDSIFKIIIDYNQIAEKIKNLGLNIEEIQIPSRLRLNETDVNSIIKIVSSIDRNTYLTVNRINKTIEGLEKTIGGKYNRLFVTDFKSLGKISLFLEDKAVIEKAEECLSMQADLVRELSFAYSPESKQRLSRKINEIMIESFSMDKIEEIINVSNDTFKAIAEYLEYVSNKKELVEKTGLPEAKEYIKILSETYSSFKNDSPTCEKLRRVYSIISVLNDVDQMIVDAQSIGALFQLLEGLKDVMVVKLNEEGCVALADLGIEPKYGRYVTSWMQTIGINATIKGDQICTPDH
ncbi:hypothetical protein GWK48_02925 [Metallosphaera tengchongensis]|uniref:Uncharacterized protein n=1 Tax=Metallosphaera tengchongensis TaxID=1532350 RepID=A0A6N0NTG7_9CREN|nr:hypothetical protein [Metallosphaera tengchongensis]QKQ99484.1 hypothetical protein GWK48_02925 [Metallosphaera tengchongensis]